MNVREKAVIITCKTRIRISMLIKCEGREFIGMMLNERYAKKKIKTNYRN